MKYITSGDYTFALIHESQYGTDQYKFVSMKKQPYPCLHIAVYEGETDANIEMLNYYKSCSLEKGGGTAYMLRASNISNGGFPLKKY